MNAPALIPMTDLERMAEAIARSGIFGIKDATQALALMLVAQAEGLHPATIVQDYDFIQGRPYRKTHSVLARFQAAGGTVKWEKLTDEAAVATFTHPAGGSVTIDWTIERARRTMVWDSKQGRYVPLADRQMYQSYPRPMLRARCIAEGVRTVYPAALGGYLVPEEAYDVIETPERYVTDEDEDETLTVELPRSKSEKLKQESLPQPSPAQEPQHETEPAPASTEAAETKDTKPMLPSQVRILRAKLKHAGLTDLDVKSKFGRGLGEGDDHPGEGWTFGDFDRVQKWIAERAQCLTSTQ